jgi:hypothetical protein
MGRFKVCIRVVHLILILAASTGPPLPARQDSLEAFRQHQEELRQYKKETRRKRLEDKRARLRDALAQARDNVQAHLLRGTPEREGPSRPASRGPAPRPTFRSGCIALTGFCLLAGDPQSWCEATGLPDIIPPSGGPASSTAQAAPGLDPQSSLAQSLTDLLMQQLASDELDGTGPMVQRALQAQQTLLENALGTALGLTAPPSAPTPGAQLVLGAFQTALAATSQDIMNDVLPPGFGPVPARRSGPPLADPSDSPALAQARIELDVAKKEVVAAIRACSDAGSNLVIAAASLLGYGSFAAVAYGLDIGASLSGIFTSPPPNGAAVATGVLSATANGFFMTAYASDAVAGAVSIHMLKEPYLDALLRLADAEAAWTQAYMAFSVLSSQAGSGSTGILANGTETGGNSTGSDSTGDDSTGGATPTDPAPASSTAPEAEGGAVPAADQTSAGTARTTPFWPFPRIPG